MLDVETEILVIGIGTVLSFVSGWLLYLLNESTTKKKEISAVCKSLIHELTDVKQYIEKREKPAYQVTSRSDDPTQKTINFKGHSLAHFAYDSMIYSGMIRDLDLDTQYRLALMYGRIKRANKSTQKIFDLTFVRESITLLHLDNIQKFAESLETNLDDISKDIPELITVLKSEMSSKPRFLSRRNSNSTTSKS